MTKYLSDLIVRLRADDDLSARMEAALAIEALLKREDRLQEVLEAVHRRMLVLITENEEVLTTTVQKHVVATYDITRVALAMVTNG